MSKPHRQSGDKYFSAHQQVSLSTAPNYSAMLSSPAGSSKLLGMRFMQRAAPRHSSQPQAAPVEVTAKPQLSPNGIAAPDVAARAPSVLSASAPNPTPAPAPTAKRRRFVTEDAWDGGGNDDVSESAVGRRSFAAFNKPLEWLLSGAISLPTELPLAAPLAPGAARSRAPPSARPLLAPAAAASRIAAYADHPALAAAAAAAAVEPPTGGLSASAARARAAALPNAVRRVSSPPDTTLDAARGRSGVGGGGRGGGGSGDRKEFSHKRQRRDKHESGALH